MRTIDELLATMGTRLRDLNARLVVLEYALGDEGPVTALSRVQNREYDRLSVEYDEITSALNVIASARRGDFA